MDKSILKQILYPLLGACQEVHTVLGPFLNEYMYQDAMAIELSLRDIPFEKEYLFTANYKGHAIEHKHYVDFCVTSNNTKILLECKAVEQLQDVHRQQLWNYMRLTGKQIGILFNFGPVKGQSEHYYLDTDGTMYMF